MSDQKDNNQNGKSAELISELDEFDLLSTKASPQAEEGQEETLIATARAFNKRIQKKKKEHLEAQGNVERQTRVRQKKMLKSLMHVRKSLREVTRIDLGENFHFSLVADDWNGWPRIMLKLINSEHTEGDYPSFTVSAHDRHESGSIDLQSSAVSKPETISAIHDPEFQKLPKALKKCVRAYLDHVGEVVLGTTKQTDTIRSEKYLEQRDTSQFEEKERSQNQIHADVFEDEGFRDNFLETLPSIDELDSLPDLTSPRGK